VLLERTRDGGHTREWSVEEIELHGAKVHFAPRSTDPKHKPIVVSRDLEADDGTTVMKRREL